MRLALILSRRKVKMVTDIVLTVAKLMKGKYIMETLIIKHNKNKTSRYQVQYRLNGDRKTISLGSMLSLAEAQTYCEQIERLANCVQRG